MRISDDLLCLFSAEVERRDGSYVIEVPTRELDVGTLQEGETYRMAMFRGSTTETDSSRQDVERDPPAPPVDEGEIREVDIEDIGEQGDGIARVERGYVVIVPDTDKGERVTVEITDVQQNVAFAEVEERQTHF